MVLFAASAPLGVSIHSYCSPVRTDEFTTDALTRNVSGRDVPLRSPTALTSMWSTMNGTDRRHTNSWFRPNHFDVLPHVSKRRNTTAVVVTPNSPGKSPGKSAERLPYEWWWLCRSSLVWPAVGGPHPTSNGRGINATTSCVACCRVRVTSQCRCCFSAISKLGVDDNT